MTRIAAAGGVEGFVRQIPALSSEQQSTTARVENGAAGQEVGLAAAASRRAGRSVGEPAVSGSARSSGVNPSAPPLLDIVPCTLGEARRFIAEHHRHNEPPLGWLFGCGLALEGDLVGVAIVGRPVSIELQRLEPRTVELTRVCTLGHKNANSRLYGAACRMAAAGGYLSAITYALEREGGASLKAAGFRVDREAQTGYGWNRAGKRARQQMTLFGARRLPDHDDKLRWRRDL